MARRAEQEGQDTPPSSPPPPSAPLPEVPVRVRYYEDANWVNGVTRGLPAGVWLDMSASQVQRGDTLLIPRANGTVDARVVQYAWGPEGAQVFLFGEVLDPSTQGTGTVVRVRSENRELYPFEVHPVVIFEPPPPKGRSIWGTVTGAVGGAIGDVVSVANDALGAALEEAAKSPWIQAAAAAATGGLSLAAQAAYEGATGKDGPILGTARDIAENPLEVLKKLPGDVLLGTGLPGLVLDAARVGGGAVAAAAGEDSAVGKAADAVRDGSQAAQDAAREDPVASIEAAVAVGLTALGIPLGPKLGQDALRRFLGDNNDGQEDAAPEAKQDTAPAEAERLHLTMLNAPTPTPRWKWAAAGLGGVGGLALLTWALAGSSK